MIKGIERFRQAIKNQRDLGNGDFRLTYRDVEEIADEIEDELESLSWAASVPAPVDADGEVVPLTTEVMYDEGGKEVLVNHFRLAGHNVGDRLKWRVREMPGAVLDLDLLHLHRPDSWERLEEDLNLGCRDYCERYRLEECDYNMRAHMFYRAKALAERDAKTPTPQPSPHGAKEVDRG